MSCPACGADNRADARFCDACGAPLGGGSGEHRKVVTVLFCDVVGSTALGESTDPEALRALLARCFERMRGIVEHHGGSVEKFIGDAVMAVFGVPVVHEDDALRACRAATEMREAFPELGIEGRIGVSTGEVVTGTEERLATGDAVNVAARLEQAAAPGEVLLGEATLALVRGAVEVEEVEPLQLNGKSEPVRAHRLLLVLEAPERRHETRFVGRQRELALITEAWERTRKPGCELVTIVGDAGVGKSRLAAEALASIEARVVRGRCLPYGEGITYWPVVEVVKQLDVLPSDPAAASAIRSLLGETDAATSAEEIAWAFRKLLEEQAPLVVLFDDVQWGEETFLDLVEHVGLLSSGAPIMLLFMARPELLDRRPSWSVTVRLEPLGTEDVNRLVGARVPEELRAKIAHAAGGNPLFIGEMLAMAEEAGGEVVVPPTLQALLAARLDQLEAAERRVLERGAVEGEIFHRGAVQALAPEETQVTPRLAGLVRKELIRPDAPQFAGEDGFRFRHLLIRDAAYDALPKSTRAELHERFAAWLEQRGQDLVELDEILGYHLEQAVRYKHELAQEDPTLAQRAGGRLTAAGRRALWRCDERAAAALLERALTLLRPIRLDVALELDLAGAQPTGHESAQVAETVAARARRRRSGRRGRCPPARRRLPLGLCRGAGARQHGRAVARAGRGSCGSRPRLECARLPRREQPLSLRGDGPGERGGAAHARRRAAGSSASRDSGASRVAARDARPLRGSVARRVRSGRAVARAHRLVRRRIAARGDRHARRRPRGDGRLPQRLLRAARGARRATHAFDVRAQARPVALRPRTVRGAEPWAKRGRELGDEQDVATQAWWRQAQALVLAHRGQHAEAEVLAREAVAIVEPTDALNFQGYALGDLAEVLQAAGRTDEAAEALEQALERCERKKNLVMASQVRARLAELQAVAT